MARRLIRTISPSQKFGGFCAHNVAAGQRPTTGEVVRAASIGGGSDGRRATEVRRP